MKKFIKRFNNFFLNFGGLGSLFLRFIIGIAFILYGTGKLPLPPEGLIKHYGLSPFVASVVAVSEISSGVVLIIANFLKNSIGHTLTRLAGLNIVILMTCILLVAHKEWFITKQLFMGVQNFSFSGWLLFFNKRQ